MATQFNRRQIRALIKESLYQMVYDKPSEMYDEEMYDEEGGEFEDFEGLDAWERDTDKTVPSRSLVKRVVPNEFDLDAEDFETSDD